MTVAERKNAAMFIQHTTVRPFIYMGSTFKCFFCLKYYSELHLLLEHTSTHILPDGEEAVMSQYIPKGKRTIQVDTSNLKCRICDDSFPTLDEIKEHLKCVHEKVFSLASNGMTEYKMNAQDGFIVCHICNDKFVGFSQINTHMNVHVGKVVCETCGKGFLNQHMLKKHRETHFLKKFDCSECNQVFLKKSKLKYHMDFIHRGKDRVKMKKCPECSETFKEYYSKMVHLKEVHGIAKTFPCTICRKPFGTRRALTEHTTKVHTERFKCEVCSQCFSIKSRLELHMRTHSGEKNFICPICQNAYMHEMTLKKHLKSHSLEFKFNCKNCGVGFQGRGEFLMHMSQCHMSRGRPETVVS